MTAIILVSDNAEKIVPLKKLMDSPDFSLISTRGYQAVIEKHSSRTFYYFDFSSFSARQKPLLLKYLGKQDEFEYGIIDPQGEIDDIAALFHDGASDYIGKKLKNIPLDISRIRNALCYYQDEDTDEKSPEREYNWNDIHPGEEYPFIMLYLEIDILPQWKTKSGKSFILGIVETFYAHLDKVFSRLEGKMWIKTDYGGLMLFPCNNKNRHIIEECVRLIINRVLISCEVFRLDMLLTYRISVDAGVTEFKNCGETGTLISDSINYIFHLGQKFTPKGNLVITEDVYDLVPDGLQDFFTEEAEFQGKRVYRLYQPLA